MDNKPTMTYIKNNKLKEAPFNKLQEKIFFKPKRLLDQKCHITNCSLLHIKNYTFSSNLIIDNPDYYTPQCKVLILENCTFEGNKLSIDRINNLRLINPKFKNDCHIMMHYSNNIEIILKEETKNIDLTISKYYTLKLIANKSLSSLSISPVYYSYTFIKNFFGNLSNPMEVYIYKLILEDSSAYINDQLEILGNYIGNIGLTNSSIESNYDLNFTRLSKLLLNNSHIKANKIEFPNLEDLIFGDKEEDTILDPSSYIEVTEQIKINQKLIKNTNQNENLIITKSSFQNDLSSKRQELLFILKELSSTINNNLEEEKQRLLEQIEKDLNKKLTLEKVDKYTINKRSS